MPRDIAMPGPVYIESCGMISTRGEVQPVRPGVHAMIDTWLAHQQSVDLERLRVLHYSGGSSHSKETVNLCRRLVMSDPESTVTLIYAHRGHHAPCKTPLLQSLLARLSPHLQVHGMRVERPDIPLDILLAGIGALCSCERCLIIKDNAVRLGTTDVASVNSIQYLVLSRTYGSWAIENIVIHEEDGFAPPTQSISLDSFVSDSRRDVDALCLASQTTRSFLGIVQIVRARRTSSIGSSGEHLTAALVSTKATTSDATLDWRVADTTQEGVANA
jgi:hypothetical protein